MLNDDFPAMQVVNQFGPKQLKHQIQLYLDYCCPYSKKMLLNMKPVFQEFVEIQFTLVHQVQSWHPQSTMMHSAALAVNQLDSSKFIEYSYLLMDKQQDFFDANCWHKSITDIFSELIDLAGTIGIDRSQVILI